MATKRPPNPQTPPPPLALFTVYGVLGAVLSFLFGHTTPGSIPENLENLVAEICPSVIVVCLFLVSYSVYDVLACGLAKAAHLDEAKKYDDTPASTRVPEAVHLAERAQANQVEQIPSFLFSTMCFSILVNGKVGAVLSLTWSVLRRMYASKYRSSVGIPLNEKGLTLYTLPCYFIVNSMLMGSAVHALRWTIMTKV